MQIHFFLFSCSLCSLVLGGFLTCFFQQALELEMDTYSGIVKEMGTMAESMIKSSHPESKMIKDRQQVWDRL